MTLLLAALACLALAGIAGAGLPEVARVTVPAGLSATGCVLAVVEAGRVLASGHVESLHVGALLPFTGVDLTLDPLGALVLATSGAVGCAASLYGVGYAAHQRSGRTGSAMLPAFIASLLLVPAAGSVVTFLVAWELMALTSTVLLLAGHASSARARDAAQWYVVMTQFGAILVVVGLVLVASHAGGQTFEEIRHAGEGLSPSLRSAAFLLILAGFGSKAGAVPLHVWLPRAHAEAPSPVSALMSGAMVNLGVYGIVRVGLDLLGGGSLWWWLVVTALGVASAFFGAVHAAAAADLKRLLAYSTIDNVGLVLLGVGAAGALADTGHRALGALALLGALFHLVNHSAFKGCLFLTAGAVQQATGTRDLDRLGGLSRALPFTTLLFGIGALSISALPPFNGFASEWLLLQGFLHGFASRSPATVVALLAGVAALALTGGLSAAAFVKALGIGFLGQARSPEAAAAREVAPSMLVGAGLLAAACLAVGLAPGLVTPDIGRAALVGLGEGAHSPLRRGLGLALDGSVGAIDPLLLVAALVAALVVLVSLARVRRTGAPRRAAAWACGREELGARMEYTATSFAEPLQRVFDDVLAPDRDVEVTNLAGSRYFLRAIGYHSRVDDVVERSWYRPVLRTIRSYGVAARRVQNGSLHRYLAFGFAALVLVLVVLA